MTKKTFIFLGKVILTLSLGVALALLLLMASYLCPVSPEHAAQSEALLQAEGWYPLATEIKSYVDHEVRWWRDPGVLDNFTDGIMISAALDRGEGNVLYKAMRPNYSYYWHGYVVILRPILYFMDYKDLRTVNLVLQLTLVWMLGLLLWRKTGEKLYPMLALAGYLLLMPMALVYSLQYSWVFYVAFVGTYVLIKREDFFEEGSRFFFLFLILGMCTSFLDLLTYPLATWGIPVCIWLAVMPDWVELSRRLFRVVSSGIAWIMGYGLFWGAKWIIASAVLKENVIECALHEIVYRSGVAEHRSVLDTLKMNWNHYDNIYFGLILTVAVIFFVRSSVLYGFRPKRGSAAYLLTAVSSVVWYAVLANHTTQHHTFTYRILAVSFLSIFALLGQSVGTGKEENESGEEGNGSGRTCRGKRIMKWREWTVVCIAWGIVAVLSLGLVLSTRESVFVMNGDRLCDKVAVRNGEKAETVFIPSVSRVKMIAVAVEPSGDAGEYLLEVLRDGETVYEFRRSLSDHMTGAFQQNPVDWKLQAGIPYLIRITFLGMSGEAEVLVSRPEESRLVELGETSVGGVRQEGQLITGFVYESHPFSYRTLYILELTWIVILKGIVMAIAGLCPEKKRRNLAR